MEDATETGIDSDAIAGAIASAIADHQAASDIYATGIKELVETANDEATQAAQVLARSVDAISGQVANDLDAIEQKLIKSLKKVVDAANYDHASAINRLTSAGARPLYVTAEMVADLERGDPVTSAYEQLIAPVSGAPTPGAPVPAESFDCPIGYEADYKLGACKLVSDDIPVSPPVSPPPPVPWPVPVDGTCPAPVVSCPAPVVYLIPPTVCPVAPPPAPSPPPPPECEVDSGGGGCPVPPDDEETEPPVVVPPGGEVLPPPRPVPIETAPEPRPVKPVFRPTLPPVGPVRFGMTRDWSSSDRCNTIAADLAMPFIPPAAPGQANGMIGQVYAGADSLLSAIWKPLVEVAGYQLPANFAPLSDTAAALEDGARGLIATLSGNQANITLNAAAAIAAANMAEKYTGAPAPYLVQAYQYDLQFANPQFLPSQENVDAMYLRGVVDASMWECLTKANGNHPWARRHVISANRTAPSIADSISLYRRGMMTLDSLRSFLRTNGVIDPQEQDMMIQSTEFVPPYTDLIRFMVRDATDPDVYQAYNYDYQFEKKFSGRIPEWAAAQGITPDVFRYLWRSHWHLPSPTQLYEMLHRLRPGRVAADVSVTKEDVKKVLIADDLAPAFVDRLTEISYHPITRTDILTFYTNGSMGANEVVERLQDTGYSQPDALRIQKAWELEVANRQQNRARVWSRINITKTYRDGGIDRVTAKQLLLRTIETPREVDQLLDDVDLQRRAMKKMKCIKAIRRRRITGELTERESRDELVKLNLDLEQASEIAEGWTCEITSMSREPLARMVLSWYRDGVIDATEATRRLRNMRYLDDAVQRMIQDAFVLETRKQAAAQQAAGRRAAADARRAAQDSIRAIDRAKKIKKCIDEGGNPETC